MHDIYIYGFPISIIFLSQIPILIKSLWKKMPPKRKLEKTEDIDDDIKDNNIIFFDPYQIICNNSAEVCSAKGLAFLQMKWFNF